MQHLTRGLQLGARHFNALGQQCQHKRRAACELQWTVAPCQPELAAGAAVADLGKNQGGRGGGQGGAGA